MHGKADRHMKLLTLERERSFGSLWDQEQCAQFCSKECVCMCVCVCVHAHVFCVPRVCVDGLCAFIECVCERESSCADREAPHIALLSLSFSLCHSHSLSPSSHHPPPTLSTYLSLFLGAPSGLQIDRCHADRQLVIGKVRVVASEVYRGNICSSS